MATLHSLKAELQTAGDTLLVALAANDETQISAQLDVIRRVKPQISVLTLRAKKLRLVIAHPMTPDASGSWMPVLRAAAKRYHLNVQALHRMMLLESGGRVLAKGGGGQFLGLFQYCLSTWKAAWNPYRSYSIFHGGAQIWATAVAIHRGWGRSMWPNTYPMAFGG